jgi:hypothetical protein
MLYNEQYTYETPAYLRLFIYAYLRVCDLETLKIIYYSLIQSHISYGISVYGGTTKTNLDKILIHQKKAIRTITKLQKTTSVKNLFMNWAY